MTSDEERIAQAVAEAREFAGVVDLLGDPRTADGNLVALMLSDPALAGAVARHLLSRDPDCVRVPMLGEVS